MANTMNDKDYPKNKDHIINQIIEGYSLRYIAKELEISNALILKWVSNDEEFRERYTRARDSQGDTFFEKIIDIVEDRSLEPNEKRVRVDALKWLAGKAKPEKYSDKLNLEHTGKIEITKKATDFTDDELAAIIARSSSKGTNEETES